MLGGKNLTPNQHNYSDTKTVYTRPNTLDVTAISVVIDTLFHNHTDGFPLPKHFYSIYCSSGFSWIVALFYQQSVSVQCKGTFPWRILSNS